MFHLQTYFFIPGIFFFSVSLYWSLLVSQNRAPSTKLLQGARKLQIKVTRFALGRASAPECVTHHNQLFYFFCFIYCKEKIHPEAEISLC